MSKTKAGKTEFVKWFGPVLDALRALGGSAKPRVISQWIGEFQNPQQLQFGMPKQNIVIIILIFVMNTIYGQGTSIIHIVEEKAYPYQSFTQKAQKQYTWTFNGKIIKYKTGKYDIKINSSDQFDTILFQIIYKRKYQYQKKARPINHAVYDTLKKVILCKFRGNHNYNLKQIFPGDFEIYSLDTFETRQSMTIKVINKKDQDTLFLEALGSENKVFCDTILTISDSNEKMKQSFLTHIRLIKTKGQFELDGIGVPDTDIFDIYFQFLHAEKMEIVYNFATNQYQLQLVN